MGFKAAASELGTEGGLRTRTDTDTVKAKSIRIRTYPYALETCLPWKVKATEDCHWATALNLLGKTPRERWGTEKHILARLFGPAQAATA